MHLPFEEFFAGNGTTEAAAEVVTIGAAYLGPSIFGQALDTLVSVEV